LSFVAERLREWAPIGLTPAFSWMDVTLGLRMLARYPGLALVGVFGIAVGVAIAAGAYASFCRSPKATASCHPEPQR